MFLMYSSVLHIKATRSFMGTGQNADYEVYIEEDFKDSKNIIQDYTVFTVSRFCGKTLKIDEEYVISGRQIGNRFRISNCEIFIPGSEINDEIKKYVRNIQNQRCKMQDYFYETKQKSMPAKFQS